VTGPLEHQDEVNSAAFSPDGRRVVTASKDHAARVWDAATGKLVIASLEHRGSVEAAAFSPDGTRVVTASGDETALVWDAMTGKPVTVPLQHQSTVNAVAFSADGTRVVTASDDKTARVWVLSVASDSIEEWQRLAGCSPFALSNGVLTENLSACLPVAQ
jgi:WD40 repeat protein